MDFKNKTAPTTLPHLSTSSLY